MEELDLNLVPCLYALLISPKFMTGLKMSFTLYFDFKGAEFLFLSGNRMNFCSYLKIARNKLEVKLRWNKNWIFVRVNLLLKR